MGRPPRTARARARGLLAGAAALVLAGWAGEASAQLTAGTGTGEVSAALAETGTPLYLEADQLIYDFDRDVISAVGNVTIAYRGYQLFAGTVTLDRRTNRFTATGGARLEEPTGTIVTAETIALDDTLRDGFARGIRVDTVLRSRFAADEAVREGDRTVFTDGVYTACHECLERPSEPPTWQIKARTIIHDESERTVYYENASLELWGIPVAYLPFFSHPDPTVRRQSGFLVPDFIYSNLLGVGVRVPYFWAIAPSYDLTFAATPLSRQGVLVDAEWRQQLLTGAYDIRVAGILQADPDAFAGTSGDRDFRGSLVSNGNFRINRLWQWGWNAVLTSDRVFLEDYEQPGGSGDTGVNTLYLTGLGERNWFDLRGYAFRILRDDFTGGDVLDPPAPFTPVGLDLQDKQPYVHPVLNYEAILDESVVGGELAYHLNLTSLSREETDAFGVLDGAGGRTARFRGVEGTFTRASAKLDWRRQLIDPVGQVWTPFLGAQVDAFFIDNADSNVTALDEESIGRAMPWIGMQYRWPWVAATAWGSQTFEPIAQIVARPDEANIGDIPNEDSQSVIFEDTSLFDVNRFSGYDRSPGGTRMDVGLRYTVQAYNGGFLSALVGQSFQVAGKNSYATPDILNSSSDSGLETAESDYVAALYLGTNAGLQLNAQGRFDQESFDIEQGQVQAAGQAGPLAARAVYAFLRRQPDLGVTENRQEIQGGASLRVLRTLRLFGQVRYDIENREMIREGVGVGYDDDSLSMSLSYAEDSSGDDDDPIDRTVFFRIGLRTLGDAGLSGGFGD